MTVTLDWRLVKAALFLVCLWAAHDVWSANQVNGRALTELQQRHAIVAAERDAALRLLGQRQVIDATHQAKWKSPAECDRAGLHRVFCRFGLWRGTVEGEAMAVNFHGVATRVAFFPTHLRESNASAPDPRSAATFVHASLLMAIVGASHDEDGGGGGVSVGDVGAAWGQWLSTAHHAARQLRGAAARVALFGVEAEPTHFRFLEQHLADNGIDARQHRLVNRVVHAGSPHTTRLPFYVGRADEWYGQCIADDARRGEEQAELEAVTIAELLRGGAATYDWLQIDVGGYRGAYELVRGGGDELRRRVRWLVVRTVDPVEHAGVRALLAADWWLVSDFEGRSEAQATPFGATVFDNGLLVAVNPRRAGASQFFQ